MAHSQGLYIPATHGVVMIPHLVTLAHNGAVLANTYGGAVACGDANHICPLVHIAAALAVVAGGDHGTVFFEAYGMPGTGINGHDIRPAFHGALGPEILAGGNHSAVLFQTNGMLFAGCDGDDIGPHYTDLPGFRPRPPRCRLP